MSCFCLANKQPGNKDESAQLAHVHDFYKLMLGTVDESSLTDISSQQSTERLDEFSTVSSSPSLTSADVAAIWSKYRSAGLIQGFAPYVIDALRRKASLNSIANAVCVPGSKELVNVTGRDMFIAAALSCTDTVRFYNIAATVPGIPLPLVIPSPSGGSLTLWDAFADILCLPRGPLVVSIGTKQSRGLGKTTLLRNLGLFGIVQTNEPIGGKLSPLSIDLYTPPLEGDPIVADCSAGFTLEDETVSHLAGAAAVAIIHVFPRDVSDRAGPSDEFKELLAPDRCRMLIVLVRDSEAWKPACRALLDATLDAFKSHIAITIDVPNYMRSVVDRATIYKSVFNNIQSVWAKCLKGGVTPSLAVLREGRTVPTVSPTTRAIWDLLDGAEKQQVSTRLFPFTTAHQRLLQLKRDERRVREDGRGDCEDSLTMIAKERGSWNAFLSNCVPSPATNWFCEQLKIANTSWLLARLVNEINEAVAQWKQPKIEELQKKQRETFDAGDAVAAAGISAQIEELNISIDSFWTELETLTSPDSPWETRLGASIEAIHAAFAFAVLAGAPVQLLKGAPLRLTDTAFLKSVLALGAKGGNNVAGQVLVVSVIGAQSSAKSTLLNFLFGCNFVTRAGRCTRGLYASFLRLADGRLLVVLDTEGLLSLETTPGEGDVFDGQMTLLAMACSQLVLINHKGEVSRQLQDLLEVCMFALKHLRVTNFQPDIFFVLRDQHDRSPAVHEDMLRHMKRHLAGCANRLGLKLEDVLRLNASSIHLLPSAYVTQMQALTNLELPHINEPIFPEEIVKLRASVMRVLNETIDRQTDADTSRMGAWHTLDQWYTHCNSVWETLTQFGHNLLHYKTIREIEVKRELTQIAADVSRHVMENGFKPEASKVLQTYVEVLSRGDWDAADVELRANLGKLKEHWAETLRETFTKQTESQERFTPTMREEVGGRLPAALDYIYDNMLYTWKLHLKQARDSGQAASMWTHFCQVLNQVLFSDPTKMAVISDTQARNLFAREWTTYEAEFVDRLEAVRKTRLAIAYEVATVCNSALAKATQERPDYEMLKSIGAAALLSNEEAGCLMNDETDDMWRLKYLNPLRLGGYEAREAEDVTRDIRTLRKMVLDIGHDVDAEILRAGTMVPETLVVDWLRSCHDVAFRDGERRMKSTKVKGPQVLAALHSDIRQIAFAALCREEDNRHRKQMDTLHRQRNEIEEHLLTMAKGNAGDVDRASSFADRYHKQIDSWLDRQVTAFAAEVRETVLSEMPDPAKAHERAFQQSFGARNWVDVLEYCLDVNGYMEKMFLTLFHRRQVAVIATRLPELEKHLRDMYATLREGVTVWYKETSAVIASGQAKGKLAPGGSGKRIFDFKQFLIENQTKSNITSDAAVLASVAAIFPPTVNFEVRDVRVFTEAFREQILARLASIKSTGVSSKVLACLQEQSVQAWAMIRGCTARCPLCGSKCDVLGDHSKHTCCHHLFPAFHGWMDKATGAPSLSFCKSDEVYSGTYQCRDGEWRGLAEYLPDSHPTWIPFPRSLVGSSESSDSDLTTLRAAWVNCKFALEKYFTPMRASNPPQWECYVEPGRQLVVGDLETAKKTIRAIRAKTWTPTIPAALKETLTGVRDEPSARSVIAGS